MTAFNVYNGDGTQTQFPITFDYFNVSEIEVLLWDSAVSKWLQKTNTVDYNIASTNINFVAAPAAPTSGITGNVLILRKTEVGTTTLTDAQAVYSPGSAIKAADLNKNQIQALRAVLDLRDSNMPIHGKTWADSSQETRLYSDLNMTGRDVKNVGKLKVETLAFTEGGVEVETDTKDIPTQAELALKDDITNVDSKLAFKDDISSVDAKLALNVTNEDTKLLLKDDVTSVNNKLALNVTNEDAKLALKDDITSVDAKLASNVSNEDAKLALKDDISSVNAKLALNVTNEDTKLAAKADLVAGKVPVSQIPEIAGAEYKGEVANQVLMLAVTGGIGDWVIRNDDSKVYVITGSDPSLASSWTALSYPAGFSGVYNDLTGKPTIPTIDPDTVIDANYVATQQNFTNADRTKLDGIDVGAEVNAVNSVNGSTGNVTIDLSVKADLIGGKLNTTQLPDIAISEYKGNVANQTAMLAITGEKGDWVIRNDDSKVYVITGTSPGNASSWTALSYPAGFSGVYNDLTGKPTLGTAAATDSTAYATAAQGTLADSATQPGDLSTVATSGDYDDLTNKPTLGTAAATNATAYATAAQGTLADSATQPGDLATVATTGTYNDLSGKPTLGTAAATASTDYATAAQGTLADSATQPGDLSTVATSGSYNDLSNQPLTPWTTATGGINYASGKVGIGTASPAGTLSIYKASNPYLYFQNSASGNGTSDGFSMVYSGSDMWIANRENGILAYESPGGTERLRIDSSGKVGIGTSSPDCRFHVVGNTGDSVPARISNNATLCTIGFETSTAANSYNVRCGNSGGNNFVIYTNNAERMRIDGAGRAMIGTTNPITNAVLNIEGTGISSVGRLALKRRNVSIGGASALGEVAFSDSGTTIAASISGRRHSGTWTSGSSQPSMLTFHTTPDGTVNNTERLRIDSSGRLLLGTTTEGLADGDNLTIADSGSCGITLRSGTSSGGAIYFSDATSGSGEYAGFVEYLHNGDALRFASGGSERMRIDSSGNVGIGLSTSLAGLCVNNTIRSQNSSSNISYVGFASYTGTSTVGSMFSYMGGDGRSTGYLNFSTADTERMRIDSSGNCVLQHTGKYILRENALTAWSMYTNGANGSLIFKDEYNASERLRIDNLGNVGIGTTSVSSSRKVEIVQPASYNSALRIKAAGNGSDAKIEWFTGLSQFAIGATQGTDALKFERDGSEKMRIDSSGRVIVGGTSVYVSDANFQVTDDTNAKFVISNPGNCTYSLAVGTDNDLAFKNESTSNEAMRIDYSNRLLVGNSANITTNGQACSLQVVGTSAAKSRIAVINRGNDATGGGIQIVKSRGTIPQCVAEDDQVGGIFWCAGDGYDYESQAARIECFIDDLPGGSDTPGRLVFSTTPNQTDSPVERMRLGSSGQIGLGGANYGTSGQVITSNGSGSAPTWQDAGGGGAWNLITTVNASGASQADITGTSSTYNQYCIIGRNVKGSATGWMYARWFDNGTLTTGNYNVVWYTIVSNSTTTMSSESDNSNFRPGRIGSGAIDRSDFILWFNATHEGSTSIFNFQWSSQNSVGNTARYQAGGGAVSTSFTNISGLRIYPDSGTITGNFQLYGIS